MGYAIELYLDPAGTAWIKALWHALARENISSLLLDIGSRPHISLAVFNNLDPDRLQEVLQSFAAAIAQREISISAVGSFPTTEGVIYLAPGVTSQILTIHDLHRRLSTLGISSNAYYHPGQH
ncbi:MAG: hypothetical protein EXR62_16545 [Chloroflexi bacterium]|nr:hypothetical protein [Chloroflexota bacterium]